MLQNRVRKLESILAELFPNADLSRDFTASDLRRSLSENGAANNYPSPASSGSPSASQSQPEPGQLAELYREPKYVKLRNNRFHGKSSAVFVVKEALQLKQEQTDNENEFDYCALPSLGKWLSWAEGMVQEVEEKPHNYSFPPEDLCLELFDTFFSHVHPVAPLLHEPTFRASYAEKEHLTPTGSGYARVLLLVCALAAKYSDDPRVVPSHEFARASTLPGHTLFKSLARADLAGMQWFEQADPSGIPFNQSARLYDVQRVALATIFTLGSKATNNAWVMSGLGMRLACEFGAHRKQENEKSLDGQLWTRAFWVLVFLDRLGSMATGRPCAIQDEEIDVELPLPIDDEYWETPATPEGKWEQPEGRPSKVDHFRHLMKLMEILAFAMRTVYAINKSKTMMGYDGPTWEEDLLSSIDSALNKWREGIPEHLHWNPSRDTKEWDFQSVIVNSMYYHVQIVVHRPFIALSGREHSALAYNSLAICTNAARSTAHLLESAQRRNIIISNVIAGHAFTAGVVLLLNIWGVKRLGLKPDRGNCVQDVFKCMAWLRMSSKKWPKAQMAWEILSEMLSLGNFPQPSATNSPPNGGTNSVIGVKRSRADDDEPPTDGFSYSYDPMNTQSVTPEVETPANGFTDSLWMTGSGTRMDPNSLLPFTSHDLKTLPLHPELSYGSGNFDGSMAGMDGAHPFLQPPNVPLDMGGSAGLMPGQALLQSQSASPPVNGMGTNGMLGQEAMTMWATAPTSFDTVDWSVFAQAFALDQTTLQ